MSSSSGEVAARMGTVTVEVRFFARYAELLERERLTLELPIGATVDDALESVRQTLADATLLPARPLAAVNRRHVRETHVLADGDEVAVFPPLAGG